jgi:hypothetical protein
MADVFDRIAETWAAPGFVRSEAARVTGGMISGKTLANLSSQGQGPPMLKLRGKSYYPLEPFIPWLRGWATGGRNDL